ncbi:MAG: hypothetical protein HY744_10525 [Deltaproteobacteria bacterium]|nr:hypothetical protein [Deltaproteobacteria bacterium]
MSQQATPYPAVSDTLRAELDRRRTSGQRFDLRAAVALVVPVCTRLVELHDAGTRLFVHPSSVRFGQGPPAPDPQLGAALPEHPADRACVAPEARRGQPGDARASVFSVGAILYEMITGASVGPGMRRPAELVPGLPQSVELVLGKALVGDPAHRPADLGALAQALHNLAPTASIPPPPADESHLDQDAGFEVDVSLSMLPPESVARGKVALGIYYGQTPVAAPAPTPAPAPEPTLGDSGIRTSTERLAQLKASLEADPRPRYIVIKDGMDHGPFTAVELLQQIAQSSFTGEMTLRDALSTEEQLLGAWEQFSPFVEQAGLRRKSQDEKRRPSTRSWAGPWC